MTPNWKIFRRPRFRSFSLLPTALAFVAILAAGLLLTACAPPAEAPGDASADSASQPATAEPVPEVTEAVRQAAETVTAEGMLEDVLVLSDDKLQGRGPGSEGDTAAQEYIAQRFEEAGLEPGAADGGWYQPFDIVGITSEAPETWTFETPEGPLAFDFWDEFIASSGVQEDTAAIDGAEVVFVGYGIRAPEHQWDDYGDADLTGKVLLMLNNDPDWDPELFEGDRRLYYGRWTYKYEIAAEVGAVGAIIIHTTPSAGYPFQVVQTSWTGPQYELPAGDEPRIQVAGWLTYDAAQELVTAAGNDLAALEESARSRDFQPVPLGVSTSLELTNTLERTQTGNVLGLAPGSDPELADEVVIFTAHHDHLGVGSPNADGDRIYNGARDNATGVAQIIAIAEAWKALPEAPKRSALFLAVGAEEQGLLGAKKYAQDPSFPPGRIAGNLNFDAGNIFGPTEDLPLVGFGKSNLDEVAVAAAELQQREVIGEIDPTLGSFYRSDQFALAKIGVPALYFGQGSRFREPGPNASKEAVEAWTDVHYHQPSDEVSDDWDPRGLVEDAQLGLFAGWMVAQRQQLPAWNPGDEFEAVRLEAVEAVTATEAAD
ncbi:MAG: M28 family peptidase [Acidobacteriota bacterium]|nr:M28 family peptidase [Acidobacteriota bacterium]